ncbi:leucine-rich repeat-containing protein 42 isoform X1 [Takifugu rubripes]|uniref:Leucine-rich repeat-containing protein 42 n=1 Tax=Takifugu rubripes TaxID=31033 RepID=A0A3B5KLZ3_TAKRU|nr:leucine-rich repeat-containing protein 42 isoform X1 [Takifugu rubripes]|eukprot:XP_011614538.1 PREDICTED: leucine-rich repeat-containing protein 42 isoform X1 [Takifugu rubripes]
MDGSTIYVRDRGNLRRVSDIVLAQPKPGSSCRRVNPLVLRKKHFIFTYNSEGSLRYTTKSLFDITLLFVADNIHNVESLVGFPEQIGDKLFAAAEENHVFLNADIASKAIKLFSDAYGGMVLGSLCLRNRFPLLHERMDEIKSFQSLKSLDLFGCRLGDNHEIFLHLTTSSLASSLVELSIGGNSLSDAGLQRLTAPIRMMKKGFDCLKSLDISHNTITDRALRYLTCLHKLEKLDVSATGLMLGTTLKNTIRDLLGLIYSERPLDIFDHARCRTAGWAEQVINQWEMCGQQVNKLKKIDESRASARRFFGRQKFVRDVLNAAPVACTRAEEAKRDVLHFYRPAASAHPPDRQTPSSTSHHQALLSCQNLKKRQRLPENGDAPRQGPPKKPTLTAEDIDLLSNY